MAIRARVSGLWSAKIPSGLNWLIRAVAASCIPRVRVSLLVLLGAVGVVLLIACANVANLVLARATGRQRELALRAALGARPARLARQLLTESVSLAVVGGACGLTMAGLSMQALRTLIPATIPRVDEIRLDGAVLAFGLFITTACGVFFGMAPALRGARASLLSALTQNGKGAIGPSRRLWRHGLVVTQAGLATMLVVMAALLLQSLVRLQQVPLGFARRRHDRSPDYPSGEVSRRDCDARVPTNVAEIDRNAAVGSGSRFHDQCSICPRSAPGSDAPRPCGGRRLVAAVRICG